MGRDAPAFLILLVGALMCAPAAPRAETEAAPPEAARWAPLDVVVNGVEKGATVVRLSGSDVLVETALLERAGLDATRGERTTIETRTWVSLRSLGESGLRWEIDETGPALRITTPAAMLGDRVLDLRPTLRPPELSVRSDASGFLNYAAQLRTDGRLGASLEAGATRGTALLYSGLSRDLDGNWTRGLTYAAYDQPERLRHWVVGDAFATGGSLAGSPLLAGLSVTRDFSLDPYLVRAPLPRTTALALTPSTLEVYVNGVLVRQERIPPGAFQLVNLPVTTGAGSVQTVVRDAYGRTQEVDSRYYYSSGLLAKGLSDYGYHLGFQREAFATESFRYGEPVLLGRHRIGVADWLTAGGRVEGARGLLSGGPALTVALPFGEVELAAAASADDGKPGAAGSLGYAYSARRLSGGAFVRAQSRAYANVTVRADDDRAVVQAGGYLGLQASDRVLLRVEYAGARLRDAGISDATTLGTDVQIASGLTLLLRGSYGRTLGGPAAPGVFAMLTYALDGRTIGDAGFQKQSNGSAAGSLGLQRSLPVGTGYGYRLEATGGGSAAAGTGQLQYQGSVGRYELTYDRAGGSQLGTASIAGGAVVLDRTLFFTRPVQQGYALIQVPGVEGVRGFVENQEVGRTDARGNLFVPALLPYYANRVAIAPTDVPLDHDLGAVEQFVATPRRAGTVARFSAEPVQPVTGIVRVAASTGPAIPVYGEMTVLAGGERFESPLDGVGHFWFQRLPPGLHPATVEHRGGRCTSLLHVPKSQDPRIDLGEVRCEPQILATPTSTPTPTPTPRPTVTRTMTSNPTPTSTATSTATPTPTATPTATATSNPKPNPTPRPTATRTTTSTATSTPTAKRHPNPARRSGGPDQHDGFRALFCGPGKVWICRTGPAPGSGWPATRCCVPARSASHKAKSGSKKTPAAGEGLRKSLVP